MIVAALGVTLISFVISHAVPADPVVSNLGQQASQRPEIVAAFRAKWGLDRPLYEQYLTFLWHTLQGDFGRSAVTKRPVADEIASRIGPTAELAVAAFLVSIAVLIGLIVFLALVVWHEVGRLFGI